MLAKGRDAQARSATQGESSKIQPRAATNCAGVTALRSASVIAINGIAGDAHVANAFPIGEREKFREDLRRIVGAFECGGERSARAGTEINEVGRFPGREVAGFILKIESFGSGARR